MLARSVVNHRCRRIVRAFKWSVGEELVPESVWSALRSVVGLQRGRTHARETQPVGPVADALVDAVLPHCATAIAAMIRLQRLTGVRSGEVCLMRACDIDMTGPVWLYRPEHHKGSHRGKPRVIHLGPQAQAVVRDFLQLDTQAYLFSPATTMKERAIALRTKRKTKVQPSQRNRRKRGRKLKEPGDRYCSQSYGRAVTVACRQAFLPPPPLCRAEGEGLNEWRARLTEEQRAELRDWHRAHHFHPHQLRHTYATTVRRAFGLESAQVALGHSGANVTEIYAERDLALAEKVAREIG